MKCKILSIDAWGTEDGGYDWNNWFTIGEFELMEQSYKEIIEELIAEGYLTELAREGAEVEDDQYNLVIKDKATQQPLLAIEYGPHV
jgi:hypothetical protein